MGSNTWDVPVTGLERASLSGAWPSAGGCADGSPTAGLSDWTTVPATVGNVTAGTVRMGGLPYDDPAALGAGTKSLDVRSPAMNAGRLPPGAQPASTPRTARGKAPGTGGSNTAAKSARKSTGKGGY